MSKNIHPTEKAYSAGADLAKRKPYLDEDKVAAIAKDWDDAEAFIDGFNDNAL